MRRRETAALLTELGANTKLGIPGTVQERLRDEPLTVATDQLARDHRETEDTLPVWGRRASDARRTTNTWKDRIRAQGVFNDDTRNASPYRRVKLVMDWTTGAPFGSGRSAKPTGCPTGTSSSTRSRWC